MQNAITGTIAFAVAFGLALSVESYAATATGTLAVIAVALFAVPALVCAVGRTGNR